MGAGDRSLTPPPGAASTAATPRRRQRAAPDSDPGGRLHGRGGPPAGAIRRPRCRNILSDSPCPLGHARGRGPILSALTSMRRWCQRRTVLYWWPDYGRQRGTVARLSPRGASGFLHVVAHTRRGRLGCWRCAARRTPLLDAASCRDWPHCVLGASPACPSGPAAGAARALGPGPPGLKFELSLSFHGHSQNASATFPVVASATFPMVTKGIGSYKQQDGGHRSRGRQRERPPRDL